MSTFIVFAGPNGSGKSSVRDSLTSPVDVVIDPDRIARQINPDDPRSVDRPAGVAAVRLFDESIAQGKSISMETTLTGHSALMRMQRAKDAGYEVSLIYVALHDPQLNVERVAARVRRGGHAIEPEIIRKRVETSLANLSRALAIANQAIVLDNSGRTHQRILETAAGRVTYLAEQLPKWLNDQMPAIVMALKVSAGPAAESGPSSASPRRSLVAGIFDNLRRPESGTAPPWAPAPAAMAERLAGFERTAAERWRSPAPPAPEPELDPRPEPSSGPKP